MAQTRNDSVAGVGQPVPPGTNPDTTRTEETADQLARGVSPTSDDASADAERAVADEPTAAANSADPAEPGLAARVAARVAALEAAQLVAANSAAVANPDLEARVAALEAALTKLQLQLQLRHML